MIIFMFNNDEMSITKQRSNTSQISQKRGFQINSNVSLDSPEQSNSQNVSVIINNAHSNNLTQDKPINLPSNPSFSQSLEQAVEDMQTTILQTPQIDETVENVPEKVLSINSNVNIDELMKLCKNKDCLIAALSVIVDIYQHNPLIINKYIIPDEQMLKDLLFCLTTADDIVFSKQDIISNVSCCSNGNNKDCCYALITKIMIKKDNQTYNFKYSYPNVIQFLEERNISWKMCC